MLTTLFMNQEAILSISAVGADGTPKPASFSAKCAPYANACVALIPPRTLHVVSKLGGPCTVTVSGHSADGTELTSQTLDFQFNPVPVPQATALVLSAAVIHNDDITTPGDPGTDTVVGSV